jgi:ATP-dependent helicase/nuclease subunit A
MATAVRRKLTDQQHLAITTRGVSVALSAGAGCGKTFVLTERFLSCLDPENGPAEVAELSQLVAITFTERAAREMRDRIRSACQGRLLAAAAAQVPYWLNLVRELDAARISTIHSFCGTLLRSHAVEAGLDPQFRVLEQTEADTLLYESLEEQLRSRLAAQDPATIDLVAQFGLERLFEMVIDLLGHRQEIDWPLWLTETAEGLVSRWQEVWRTETLPRLLEEVVHSRGAQTMREIFSQSRPSNAAMLQRCQDFAEQLPRLPESDDPLAALAALRENAKVQGGGGAKAWPSAEIYEAFRGAAEELRALIDKARPQANFDPEVSRPAAATSLALLALAHGVNQSHERRKQELVALDFDDLLIQARQLLTGPGNRGLQRRLARQIRLLLVDEFQDTDPLQVELVEALCGSDLMRGKLFFVGDYKQSIYRFRGADPRVFRQLRDATPDRGRLPLSLNFRSQPAILDFVNALFCDALGPNYERLRAQRPQVGPLPATEWIWAVDDEDAGAGSQEELRRREADWIARRVRAMLDAGEKIVWDQEAAARGQPGVRAVRPGDIAILFRALSNVSYYEEALRNYGIDYYLVGGHAFYAQQEIFDLLNLLRALASPDDQVSLAGVLRSPFFNLEDETLFWLSRHPQGLPAGLMSASLPAEIQGPQRQRVQFAVAVLCDLRAIKNRVPIAALIQEALERTGYDAVLLAEFLGERKLANLRKLIDQARRFDQAGIFTLSDFITQLSEFIARQPNEPLAATHPESTNVLRLMTIHQSKGLEFPVVVVPDVDRPTRGPTGSVAFTGQLGPMVRCAEEPGGFELHQRAEREEEEAELVRLLYVATTRAADYLILSAGVPQIGSGKGPWTRLLNRRFDPASGKVCVALPQGYPEPQIRVIDAPPTVEKPASGATPRRDLTKMVEKALEIAQRGGGRFPQYLAPVPVDATARRRYSFSRLSGLLHAKETAGEVVMPDDDSSPAPPRIDPLGLGTLVHAVMAEMTPGEPFDVAAAVKRQAARHLPDAEEQGDEAIGMIGRFLESPRAAQLAAAKQVHAELDFLLAWPPQIKRPSRDQPGNVRRPQQRAVVNASAIGTTNSAGPYLQGFLDCLYQDAAGQWQILDYKTNQATEGTLERVAAGYEMQMLLYALAAEQILGVGPASMVLCFLRPGLEYVFSWNTKARRRAVELVDQAIAAAGQAG